MAVAVSLGGCASLTGVFGAGESATRVESIGPDPVVLTGRFPTAVYANGAAVETSIILSDIDPDQLVAGTVRNGQLLHLELLWMPRAGSTPVEASATNTSIRYVIFSEGEVGIYGGAGFAMPAGQPGQSRFSITVRDASLRLLNSTEGFVDRLTPARLSGSVTATLDQRKTRMLHYAASQIVTDALGESFFVNNNRDRWLVAADETSTHWDAPQADAPAIRP